MIPSKQYPPGSNGAIKRGCTCPVLDNHHGAGFPYGDVEKAYWINGGCKLHAMKVVEGEHGVE